MASIYFAGQVNQYHVQYGFRKIEHRHFNFKLFGFEVMKTQIFLNNCEENSHEEQRKLFKGLPQTLVMRQGCKAECHFKPKECGSGMSQSAQHATYKGITTQIKPNKFNWNIS